MFNLFKKLDEGIFNFRGKAVPGYEGASLIYIVPAFCGICLGCYYFFFHSLTGSHSGNSDEAVLQIAFMWGIPVWLLNEFLYLKRVFILPGFFRKFFYPMFVALCTFSIFFLFFIGTVMLWWLLVLVIVLKVLLISVLSALNTPSSSSPSLPSSSPEPAPSSSDKESSRQAVIPDGYSAWGTTLTHQGGDNWKGNDGNEYTQNWDGSFTKK